MKLMVILFQKITVCHAIPLVRSVMVVHKSNAFFVIKIIIFQNKSYVNSVQERGFTIMASIALNAQLIVKYVMDHIFKIVKSVSMDIIFIQKMVCVGNAQRTYFIHIMILKEKKYVEIVTFHVKHAMDSLL